MCDNCETTQGPFDREYLLETRRSYSTCKQKVVKDCLERRKKLDVSRYGQEGSWTPFVYTGTTPAEGIDSKFASETGN